MAKIKLESQKQLRNNFCFEIPNAQTYTSDGIVEDGGFGEYPSPIDWLMSGLGNCILTTMAMVATRSKIDFEGTNLSIVRTFTKPPRKRICTLQIEVEFPIEYDDISLKKLKNAIVACPAKNSLHPDIHTTITFSFKNSDKIITEEL